MTVPVPIPRARIELAGRPLEEGIARSVSSIVVRQVLNAPSLCEVTLRDPPVEEVEEGGMRPEQELRVRFAGERTRSFEGRLVALEYGFEGDAGRVIRLRAYDRLERLRRSRHVRVLTQRTLHDLARDVAAPAGLSVVGGEDARLPNQLIQHRGSDLDFLIEWAGRYGFYLACAGDTLRLVRLDPAAPGLTLHRNEGGWRARFERTVDGACERTSTVGWDAGTLERRSGRWPSEAPPDGGPLALWRTNLLLRAGDDETERARAEMERRDSGRLVIWATGTGDARIAPGTAVAVHGFGEALEATQTVTQVEHTLDEQAGFVTEFTTDPPRLPAGREATEVTVARVADVDDPDDAGRVRVALEAFGAVTSDWLPVMIAGAGSGKGLTIYPERDDLVLVLLCGPDPSSGIVLGGLYGREASADAEVAARRPRPYSLRTAGGQRLRLDEEGDLVRLENADGSYLEMTGAEVVLHASKDLRIEAPGRTLTLGAASIDMRSR